MADIQNLVNMVQARVGNTSPGYQALIKSCAETIWADVGGRVPFWFLRAPAPEALSLTTTTRIYEIDRKVGRMDFIANSDGKRVIDYCEPQSFQAYLSGDVSTDVSSGTPTKFTLYGMKSGKKLIILNITPSEAATRYLHYYEKATLGNIDRLPDGGLLTLFHGVMSIIAPPEERKRSAEGMSWWRAITYREHEIYEEKLATMRAEYLAVSPHVQPPVLDQWIEDKMQEANEA